MCLLLLLSEGEVELKILFLVAGKILRNSGIFHESMIQSKWFTFLMGGNR